MLIPSFSVSGSPPDGRLHRRRRDHLHEVVDHDVAQRPDRVVEAAAVLDAEVLGHRDLDARDVQPVPDRLEHRVREAQVEHLVQAHLAQEVVDAQELGLVEVAVHLGVERAGGREVVAERLLHDHARVLRQAGLVEAPDDRSRTGRAGSRGRTPACSRRPSRRGRARTSPRPRSRPTRRRGAWRSARRPRRPPPRRSPRCTPSRARGAGRRSSRCWRRRRSGSAAARGARAGTATGTS